MFVEYKTRRKYSQSYNNTLLETWSVAYVCLETFAHTVILRLFTK